MSSGLVLWPASNAAAEALADQGLFLPEKPRNEMPEIPTDITDLDDSGLMLLFTALTAWCAFAASQLACAQVDERSAQNALTRMEQSALSSGWEGKTAERVSVAKAKAAGSPAVEAASGVYEYRYNYRKLVEVIFNNLERDIALVSRELTRRTSDPRNMRKDKFTT